MPHLLYLCLRGFLSEGGHGNNMVDAPLTRLAAVVLQTHAVLKEFLKVDE